LKKKLRFFLIVFLCFSLLWVQTAWALISISQEIVLGRRILRELRNEVTFVTDLELNAYVTFVGKRLENKGVGVSPFHFHFFVIKDNTFNAFSVPGGYIFINSGVFEHIKSEDELAGIIAHEMAHNLCRHIARRLQTAQRIEAVTLATIIAAILVGNPKLVNAVAATSIAAGETKLLAYSRQDEEEADRIGFQILVKAGYNPWGMVDIMKRLARESNLAVELTYKYLLTHPLPQERLTYLTILAKNYTSNKTPADIICPDKVYFKRLCIKATVISEDPQSLVLAYKESLSYKKDPWKLYGLALCLEKEGFFKEADEVLKRALKLLPKKPYFKLDVAEILIKEGKPEQALKVLSKVKVNSKGKGYHKIVYSKYLYLKGKALTLLGKYKEAYKNFSFILKICRRAIENVPDFFFYFGKSASMIGRAGEAHYLFGKYYEKVGDYKVALYHFKQALLFLNKKDKMFFKVKEELKKLRG